MKKILMAVLSGFLAISATAQTITLTFNGANKNINYQVLLDGKSYYSNSSTYPTNVTKEVALTNQRFGNHKIMVYRLRSNSGTYRNEINTRPYGNAIYTKTFELREGYDMNITVNGNGRVSFSESDIENLSDQGNNEQNNNIMAMSDVRFEQLLQSVRSKYLQSSKVTVERNAFLTPSNYFTTEQVSQLLSLVSSEANRLTLAKLAYPRVTDPTNFTQLYEVFTSENSKDEMNVFIRNNPNNNSNNNNSNNNNNNGNWGNNNTKVPMANYQFNQLLQTINGQSNQGGKFNIISGAFSNNSNYFSTAQIRQMLSLISGESDRLALAKLSYSRVYDPANFSTLYDLLNSQASRNDLNNYVIQNGGAGTNVQYNTNSRTPMTDASFSQVLQKVSNHFLPWDKIRDARDAFNNSAYYFNTYQIRQILTVISSENDRLELAKLAWSRVTDPTNFTQLFDLFTTQASRDNLNAYIQSRPY